MGERLFQAKDATNSDIVATGLRCCVNSSGELGHVFSTPSAASPAPYHLPHALPLRVSRDLRAGGTAQIPSVLKCHWTRGPLWGRVASALDARKRAQVVRSDGAYPVNSVSCRCLQAGPAIEATASRISDCRSRCSVSRVRWRRRSRAGIVVPDRPPLRNGLAWHRSGSLLRRTRRQTAGQASVRVASPCSCRLPLGDRLLLEQA